MEIENGSRFKMGFGMAGTGQSGSEGLGRPMRHPRVSKLRVRVNRARDKAAEEGSRGRPVKTMVVVQHAFEHE